MADTPDLEALQIAVKTEEDGHEFYLKAVERSSIDLAKQTFQSLADQELDHIDVIKKFYEKLRKGVTIDEVDELIKGGAKQHDELGTIFTSSIKNVRDKVQPTTEDKEVYQTAIDLEVNAMDFYKKMKAETKDESACKFYSFLYDMEYWHHKVLDNSLTYLENPADWFHLQEGWTVEG